MKKILILPLLMTMIPAMSQTADKNPKDLWTHSVEVTLGDDWKQNSISIPGNGEPNVVDFFRAFAKAYPCEYHDLLLMAIDGDKEVLFRHERPYIEIDDDLCYLRNESFAMRVFYENDKPAAVGVCCHKALTTKLQDAYYYRYDTKTRKLTPFAQGSDFTGGIIKRNTIFRTGRTNNEATMAHGCGRCSIETLLVWKNGGFETKDKTKGFFTPHNTKTSVRTVLNNVLMKNEIELREPREPQPGPPRPGSTYNSLPICTAVLSKDSKGSYAAASTIDGFYYFKARGWDKTDDNRIVAIYTECAPENDYERGKDGHLVTTPHKLAPGDEVILNFYLCDSSGKITYIDPASPLFESTIGKGMPDLVHNEWRCVVSPDNEDLIFVSEVDGTRKVFKWDRDLFKEQ